MVPVTSTSFILAGLALAGLRAEGPGRTLGRLAAGTVLLASLLTLASYALRILQVLANLLGNALKFSPEGATVTLEEGRAGDEARVSVRDRGPGIPEAQRAHLFERHWQAPGQGARQGSGLGLYIVQGIIAAHGGRVWVESTVGEGSTFTFTLPLSPPGQAASEA